MNNISGNNREETLSRLIKSLMHIYNDMAQEYLELASKTSKGNIRKVLIEFSEEARQDIKKLEELIKTGVSNFKISNEEMGIISHLEPKIDELDDEEKLIFDAIKKSEELQGLYKLIINEYKDEKINEVFNQLISHENYRRKELQELYENMVIKDEW
jgi:rubrerythrin